MCFCECCVRCKGRGVIVVDLASDSVNHRGLVVTTLLSVFAVIAAVACIPILSANLNFSLTEEKLGEVRVLQRPPSSTRFGADWPLDAKVRVFSEGGRPLSDRAVRIRVALDNGDVLENSVERVRADVLLNRCVIYRMFPLFLMAPNIDCMLSRGTTM